MKISNDKGVNIAIWVFILVFTVWNYSATHELFYTIMMSITIFAVIWIFIRIVRLVLGIFNMCPRCKRLGAMVYSTTGTLYQTKNKTIKDASGKVIGTIEEPDKNKASYYRYGKTCKYCGYVGKVGQHVNPD